jgi:hypothetical protein
MVPEFISMNFENMQSTTKFLPFDTLACFANSATVTEESITISDFWG